MTYLVLIQHSVQKDLIINSNTNQNQYNDNNYEKSGRSSSSNSNNNSDNSNMPNSADNFKKAAVEFLSWFFSNLGYILVKILEIALEVML